MKKHTLLYVILFSIVALGFYLFHQPRNTNAKTTEISGSKVIVYYLHNTFRCPSCHKIETYTKEALNTNFPDKLKDGRLVFKIINFDKKPNKHYIEDYNLYTKSVILSRIENGKQTEWKNLDNVWTLLGDKNNFQKYIKTETTNFLNGSK